MADKPASERTEAPTPQRIRKAREEGRTPQSQEVPSALVVGMFVVALALTAEDLYGWFFSQVRDCMTSDPGGGLDQASVGGLLRGKLLASITIAAPFFIVGGAASVLASLLASG